MVLRNAAFIRLLTSKLLNLPVGKVGPVLSSHVENSIFWFVLHWLSSVSALSELAKRTCIKLTPKMPKAIVLLAPNHSSYTHRSKGEFSCDATVLKLLIAVVEIYAWPSYRWAPSAEAMFSEQWRGTSRVCSLLWSSFTSVSPLQSLLW